MLVNEQELKVVALACPKCGEHQACDVRGDYTYDAPELRHHGGVYYALSECPACHEPFLTEHSWGYVGADEGAFSIDPPRVLYPHAGDTFDDSVPGAIAASYLEARRVFSVASPTATAIMCRRTLEGICQHFGAVEGNMPKRLNALKEAGRLDPRLHEWANEVLRTLGNDAAHDISTVIEQDDAKDALEFTKALIQHLFVLERAYELFKARRGDRKQFQEGMRAWIDKNADPANKT